MGARVARLDDAHADTAQRDAIYGDNADYIRNDSSEFIAACAAGLAQIEWGVTGPAPFAGTPGGPISASEPVGAPARSRSAMIVSSDRFNRSTISTVDPDPFDGEAQTTLSAPSHQGRTTR